MRRPEPIGLVASGAVRESFVARLPALLGQLGPVSGTSYAAARRTVKTLRAGFAVSHYSALELCSVIWIVAPESNLERLVGDLAAQTPIHKTVVVLCGSIHDSLWPTALHAAGARIASLNAIEESRERVFVAEGHPYAIRTVRKLLAQDGRKSIQIRSSGKTLYFEGIRMATEQLLPPVAASVECLRAAGFPRPDAVELVQSVGARVLRAYAKGGDKASRRPAGSETTPGGPLSRVARAGPGRVP